MKAMYVVMGTTTQGKTAFFDEDRSSGGYPFANTAFGMRTNDIMRAVGWLKQCGHGSMCDIKDAKIHRIDFVPVDISDIEADQKRVADLIEGMSAEQLTIMKRELNK